MPVPCSILVVALLTAPAEQPVPVVDPVEWPSLRAALYGQAVEWELLDSREERFVHLEELGNDLAVMRKRYHDLLDAPPLRDAARFPDRRQVSDLLGFNRAYRRNLAAREVMDRDRSYLLKEAQREADELYQIWELVREAGCDIYYVPVRREALKRLRDRLGDAAYQAGDLPPNVPLWRFVAVK